MLALELVRADLAGAAVGDRLTARLASVVSDRLASLEGDDYTVLLTAFCAAVPTTGQVERATGLSPTRLQRAIENA